MVLIKEKIAMADWSTHKTTATTNKKIPKYLNQELKCRLQKKAFDHPENAHRPDAGG